jgi:hypothetical protein
VSGQRLSGRDYKHKRRSSLGMDLAQLSVFGIGLAAGLCVAGLIYIADHHAADVAPEAPHPTPHKGAGDAGTGAGGGADAATAAAGGEGKYDFYQMLPKFEVVVPEKEHGARLPPAAQIDRPGVYFLQAGSYRSFDEADRVRAQLVKQGIDASVQRVAVDTDVWHRVRIGPISDLAKLNRLRQQLRQGDLDSLVIRVDD